MVVGLVRIITASKDPGAQPVLHEVVRDVSLSLVGRTGVVDAELAGPLGSCRDLCGPRGRTLSALLREDLDHAARGFGAVECGSCRALDDLDPLDVTGVDLVEWTDRDVATPAAATVGRVRVRKRPAPDAHAVHVDHRVIVERRAVNATEPDDLRLADRTAAV